MEAAQSGEHARLDAAHPHTSAKAKSLRRTGAPAGTAGVSLELVSGARAAATALGGAAVAGSDPPDLPSRPSLLGGYQSRCRAIFGSGALSLQRLPALLHPASKFWDPRGVGGHAPGPGQLLQVLDAAYLALPGDWVRAVEAGLPPGAQDHRHLRCSPLDQGAMAGALAAVAGQLG